MIIRESGVSLGNFNDQDCFHIEESKIYKNLLPYGIKTTECILVKNEKLLFIEVKKSAPTVEVSSKCKECKQLILEKQSCVACQQRVSPWNQYVAELETKFQHTLVIYLLACIGRYELDSDESEVISYQNQQMNLRDREIILLLIITTEQEWALNKDNIEQIQSQLRRQLNPLLKLWRAELVVLNRDMADKKHLIYHEN